MCIVLSLWDDRVEREKKKEIGTSTQLSQLKKMDDWTHTLTIELVCAVHATQVVQHVFPTSSFWDFFIFLPTPLPAHLFFSYRTREGENWIFQLFKPVFPVPFDSLSSLKIVIKGKYTQNAGKFFSILKRRRRRGRRRKKEARRTNESETCIINLCAAPRSTSFLKSQFGPADSERVYI